VAVPKQFCSLLGSSSLLQSAIARAERLVPRERVVVVVAREHSAWWRSQLSHLPATNVVVQPRNRGTGPGLLLPLARILAQDADAAVLVLPSDHHVADEAQLAAAAAAALGSVADGAAGILLVGVPAEAPVPDLGWIVPASCEQLARVAAFVEKPDPAHAQRLFAAGALWNTFIFAARARTLRAQIGRAVPGVAEEIRDALLLGGDALHRLYDVMPGFDFSTRVLQRSTEELRLLRAPACGWTDLGTPERVAQCLARLRRERVIAGPPTPRILDLGRHLDRSDDPRRYRWSPSHPLAAEGPAALASGA